MFSVEVNSGGSGGSGDGNSSGRRNYIYVRAHAASGSWFITIIIRGHSPRPPQGFYFYYFSFLSFLPIRLRLYTVSGLYCMRIRSRIHTHTRRSLVIFGIGRYRALGKWFSISSADLTKRNWHVNRRGFFG